MKYFFHLFNLIFIYIEYSLNPFSLIWLYLFNLIALYPFNLTIYIHSIQSGKLEKYIFNLGDWVEPLDQKEKGWERIIARI